MKKRDLIKRHDIIPRLKFARHIQKRHETYIKTNDVMLIFSVIRQQHPEGRFGKEKQGSRAITSLLPIMGLAYPGKAVSSEIMHASSDNTFKEPSNPVGPSEGDDDRSQTSSHPSEDVTRLES